ncbi:hypothetical protein EII21_04850 [Conchiformibius steedae]|uniref:Uncharacterized protein n=2 Tax=Conchiformibius steedae TaxID=153493 RepID=A0A3P2A6V0_9NEIS|nr:hypothetical protein EII21_04850 [Conchiformibius steedae]
MGLFACSPQGLEIVPAKDLNTFYRHTNWKIFSVKSVSKKIRCRDLENWAQRNLTAFSDKKYKFYFLKESEQLTFQGNADLKDEYDILLFEYNICMMQGDKKECYYCAES